MDETRTLQTRIFFCANGPNPSSFHEGKTMPPGICDVHIRGGIKVRMGDIGQAGICIRKGKKRQINKNRGGFSCSGRGLEGESLFSVQKFTLEKNWP